MTFESSKRASRGRSSTCTTIASSTPAVKSLQARKPLGMGRSGHKVRRPRAAPNRFDRMPSVLLSRLEGSIQPRWAPLRRVLAAVLRDHGVSGTLSLALVSDDQIRSLHREFLNEDRATDVISFPLESPPSASQPRGRGRPKGIFGEVVVSSETALREARKRRLPPEEELALYAIHGTLHLVGFDDRDRESRRKMRQAERWYLEEYRSVSAPLRSSLRPGQRPRRELRAAGRASRPPLAA